MAVTRRRCVLFAGCAVFALAGLTQSAKPPEQARPSGAASSPAAAVRRVSPRADVERFRQRVEAALSQPGPDKGTWGILVTDAVTGEVLYARNPDSLFLPASCAKLFTTAMALATLGPDHRLRTEVKAIGTIDANGVLNGDLILIGAGDANLSNRKFPYNKKEEREGPPEKALAELADAVVAHGVKEITGNIIADDSIFKHVRFPSGWLADDFLWSYGAAVSAIAVNDNVLPLVLHPGDRVQEYRVREGTRYDENARYEAGLGADFYNIEFSVGTSSHGSKEDLTVARDPGSRVLHISGTIPVEASPRKLSIGIEEPAEYAAYVLMRLLEARGVPMDGSRFLGRHAEDPRVACDHCTIPETVVAEHTSVPLSDDVRLTNKESLNLHAELMLLLAGRESAGPGATYDDALKVANAFFETAGIPDGDVVLTDGSGLSRKDLVTPRAAVQLLRYASTQPWGEIFRSSLPVAGEDGTLSERMKATPAAGHVFAKTGTIEHANALAGYATTARGAKLIFSILGDNNAMHASDANKVIDTIAVAMVEELGPAQQKKKK